MSIVVASHHELHPLLLGHVPTPIAPIDHLRSVVGAERVLYLELARLDEHLPSQIVLEEHLVAWRQGAPGAGS